MKIFSLTLVMIISLISLHAQFVNIGGIKGASSLDRLHCSAQKIYAFSKEIIYVSENDGVKWDYLAEIDGEAYYSNIFSNGDNLAFIGAEDDVIFDEFYFYNSKNGGKTWERKLIESSGIDLAFLDNISITIEGELIVISMDYNLILSTDGGKTFKVFDFEGMDNNNTVHFLNGQFYFIENHRIRISKDLKNFESLSLNHINNILYHFKSADRLYIYDGELKVLRDSIFESLGTKNDHLEFSKSSYFENKIYLYGENSIKVYDEIKNEFRNVLGFGETKILTINNGNVYFQDIDNPESLYRKSLEAANAPGVSISNFNIIRDANIYSANDVLWHDKFQLAYFDININRWRTTPFNKTKNELYGVINKNEIFIKKPQASIVDINGIKIRNSIIDSDILSLISCGDILIGKSEDNKLYGLHKGILPWIEIPTLSVWDDIHAIVTQGKYIIHNGKTQMLTSNDGYIWNFLSTQNLGNIVSTRYTDEGKLIVATQSKIYLYDEISKVWQVVSTDNLPFTKILISGIESFKNILFVSQVNGGLVYSSNLGVDWQRWEEGLPNFGFKNIILSGDNLFVNFNGELYMRSLKEILDLNILGDNAKFDPALLLFPIPVRDFLNFQIDEAYTIQNINIRNLEGICIKQKSFYEDKTIDVSMLPTGMYYLQVETTTGVLNQKFVKLD